MLTPLVLSVLLGNRWIFVPCVVPKDHLISWESLLFWDLYAFCRICACQSFFHISISRQSLAQFLALVQGIISYSNKTDSLGWHGSGNAMEWNEASLICCHICEFELFMPTRNFPPTFFALWHFIFIEFRQWLLKVNAILKTLQPKMKCTPNVVNHPDSLVLYWSYNVDAKYR